MEVLYIFLDEGGNFDFSPKGSQYFTFTSVVRKRPFLLNTVLDNYKYDLIEFGINQEYFHCAEDNKRIRAKVFERIEQHQDTLIIDNLIIDKRKTGLALREPKRFYPEMLGYLLRYVLEKEQKKNLDEVIIITDSIPVKSKKQAMEKAVKQTLSRMLPAQVKYRVIHQSSKAHFGLQIADYCNWAILRKYERGDAEFYSRVEPMIRSEFDIFRNGRTTHY
jgi:hypothetical protein